MKFYLKLSIYFTSLFYFTACGGGSSGTVLGESVERNSSNLSLEKLSLYQPHLKFVQGDRKYQLTTIDALNDTVSEQTYNFTSKTFQNASEQKLIINGTEALESQISYKLEENGTLIARLLETKLFELILTNTTPLNNHSLSNYRDEIVVSGTLYEITKNYFANFLILEELVNTKNYDTVQSFIEEHQTLPFIGSYQRGLVFGNGNKLLELKNGNYTESGSYRIEQHDGREILLIDSKNPDFYYLQKACYVLDLSYIWKSRCSFKQSQEKLKFYSPSIVQSIKKHLAENFATVQITI